MKTIIIILSLIMSAHSARASLPNDYAVIANRGDSSISVIDSQSKAVLKTIDDKTLGFEFEPMYVSHLKSEKLFVVGDRKNNQVLLFDDESAKFLGKIPTSQGPFHQWVKPGEREFVVATDVETGADIIRLKREEGKIKYIKKSFRVSQGKPHDVVIDGTHFYLSVHDKDSDGNSFDRLLKVDKKSLKIEKEEIFSADIHLGLPQNSENLIVAEQSGRLHLLHRSDLSSKNQIEGISGAHGLYWNDEGSRIFVANIASSGKEALFDIHLKNEALDMIHLADAGFSTSHNIAVDFINNKLFLTHSGQNNKVSVYDISGAATLLGEVQTGANPFGLAVINR